MKIPASIPCPTEKIIFRLHPRAVVVPVAGLLLQVRAALAGLVLLPALRAALALEDPVVEILILEKSIGRPGLKERF
jgi:hypothetical protein